MMVKHGKNLASSFVWAQCYIAKFNSHLDMSNFNENVYVK